MQIETKKVISVTLILDVQETEWLHAVMQNPLHYDNPADETSLDKKMRHAFFEATRPI